MHVAPFLLYSVLVGEITRPTKNCSRTFRVQWQSQALGRRPCTYDMVPAASGTARERTITSCTLYIGASYSGVHIT